ncbi:MAG: DUF4011 domain-containing protein [Fibrobacter sp.]|nr:DUF4011 domain-containing protein [Fibrobacter sp.]
MANITPSSIIEKIRLEAALLDPKDRLLNFSSKAEFQSPFIMEAGDLFYEKWRQSGESQLLDSFFPITANFTPQQKISLVNEMTTVLREKKEDFGVTDLYLVLGFLKWDGNALSPTLLVPVDVNLDKRTLSLSKQPVIENTVLRERLKDRISLPKAEEAVVNGQFSILLYFSLFEKAVAAEKNWKFTRHGLCLCFFDSAKLLLRKRMEIGFSNKEVDSHPVLSSLLSRSGFEVMESLFEDSDFDHVYTPANHHFLYPTDSHTTRVVIDALNSKACAYAVQALPGTSKMKVAANIVSDAIAKDQKVLVVNKRAITAAQFKNFWNPPFRTFAESNREALAQEVKASRTELLNYYDLVNKPIQPAGILLPELLTEFLSVKAPKQKIPETVFNGVAELDFKKYQALKADLQQLIDLYYNKKGAEARNAFLSVKVPSLTVEKQDNIAQELNNAVQCVEMLETTIKLLESAGLFPTGLFLSSLADILQIIKENFDTETPVFEDWQLRSSNWDSYKPTLLKLPEAGDQWVRYRRQTSEIYTDDAVDANIYAAREEFIQSTKATLKGLSDRYRSARKVLTKVLKKPKSVTNDDQLLDLIDTLLELQENKKAYKESSVLGNHLLGKDWLYEKSDWVELNKKINFIYNFREAHKKDARLDLLLQMLEKWHLLKEIIPEIDLLLTKVAELQKCIRQVSKDMKLETPLDTLDINKWMDTLWLWSENWNNLDIHLQLTALYTKIEEYNCPALSAFVQNANTMTPDIYTAYIHHWSAMQIQVATKACPGIFTTDPKARFQKGKAYRELLDQFSNANFKELHDSVKADPGKLTVQHLNEALCAPQSQTYDIALILDADCISVVEAIPVILSAKKSIFVGDPHNPNLEQLPLDAFNEKPQPHTPLFIENILATALRQGVPTREIWLSRHYVDSSIISFANEKIYNYGIKQLPPPHRDPFKGIKYRVVEDKVLAIAQAAIRHAERSPSKTLGILAFHQSTCTEIEKAIRSMLTAGTPTARFFDQSNPEIRYFVKTPERAVDRYRDVVLICLDNDGSSSLASDRKISVCTTLAKAETHAFISETDLSKRSSSKNNLYWEWISYLQGKDHTEKTETQGSSDSPIKQQIIDALTKEGITVEESLCRGGISVGPVIVDKNNPNHFLAVIEDDCTTERFRDSVEDRVCIRPTTLKQQGWKILSMWLPFWYMTQSDEVGHLTATIAIEQSVAPPPSEEVEEEDAVEILAEPSLVVPYVVQHPKIEGTPHDKPIAELPATAIITQLKFYVDHEGPIHEDILLMRVLELHHVDRAGPVLQKALLDAIEQGLQKKRFVKTGPFFYPLQQAEMSPRDRSARPDFERKLAYVSPEERAKMPQSMNEHGIKQALGLIE